MDSILHILELLIRLIFGLLSGVTTVIFAAYAYQCLFAWRQLKRRQRYPERFQYQDITSTNPTIPEAAVSMIKTVEYLGFQYVGAIGIERDGASFINRVYANESATVILLIVGSKKRYSSLFYTIYDDAYTLSTAYPLGINVQLPTIEVNSIKSSVDAAYDYHLGRSQALIETHGAPQTLSDMQVVMAWYEHHARHDTIQQFQQMFVQSRQVALVYAAASILVGISMGLVVSMGWTMLMLIALILVALLIIVTIKRWGVPHYVMTVEQRKKKKRGA